MKKLEDFPAEWVDIVTEEMLQLGVPGHLKGYQYIRMALLMTLEDPEVVCQVTKLLYPDLAKCYGIPDSKKLKGPYAMPLRCLGPEGMLITFVMCLGTVAWKDVTGRQTVNIWLWLQIK